MKPTEATTNEAGRDYAKLVTFRAPREKVFDAIATVDGLRSWWTTTVTGSATKGGHIRLGYAGLDECIVMRVDETTRPSKVHWTCLAHTRFNDWSRTQVKFDLVEQTADACELNFRHVGLQPELRCYEICEPGWDRFLTSLVAYVEEGRGAPFGLST
jgi:uncharacterized protein YndB with AHSA1/START domain